MDIYQKKKLKNWILGIIMIIAVVLQFSGRNQEGWGGLGIQMISLAMILLVLWLYNRRYQ